MRIYTKRGDKGETDSISEGRVKKSSNIIEYYGSIDELTSFLGVVKAQLSPQNYDIIKLIERIQKKLIELPSFIVDEKEIKELEDDIDHYNSKLKPLKGFVIPGNTKTGSYIHISRTICRKAERNLVALNNEEYNAIKYLNRLSDLLFVLARFVDENE